MEMLDLAIRTLFSEFQETVYNRCKIEEEFDKQATFVKKAVKRKIYWYLQRYVDGQTAQKYFGPSNSQNDKIVSQKREDRKIQRKLLKQLSNSENRLTVLLRRAGLPSLDSKSASVISALSACGPVMVGSHAFSAYCGMLGVLFAHNLLRTGDIDVAFDNAIEISGEPKNILDVLKNIDAGFREVPGWSYKYPPHSFIGPDGMRIDIVAPLVGKPRPSIRIKKIFGAAAQPLRFLDFLLKDPVKTVLIGPKGGIPVLVPDPARYALHKLIVSSYRPAVENSKKAKDLAQAHQLLKVCAEERRSDLLVAYRDAIKHGPKWKKLVNENLPSDIAEIFGQ